MTAPSSLTTRPTIEGRKGSRRRRPANRGPARWILSAPLLVFLAVLVAFPIVYGVQSSLTSKTLLDPTPTWVGLGNFGAVLTDPGFWHSALFTLLYTVVVTAFELAFGFGLALLFDKDFPAKKFLLSAVILPIMIAPALMGIMFRLLLNSNIGLLPGFLHSIGVDVPLLGAGTVVPMLMGLDVLQWTPFTFLLFHAALQSVPGELYEAAQLDRANYPRFVVSILLPLMVPTIFIAGFLRAIDAFRTFDTINVLTSGGPGDNTTTLSIYIYKILSAGNFGTASAAALIVALIMLPLVPVVVRRITRGAV